jgi:hypothetical protein
MRRNCPLLPKRKLFIKGNVTLLCGYVLDSKNQVLSIKIDDGLTIEVPAGDNKAKGYISVAIPTSNEMYLARDGANFAKPIKSTAINFNFGMERFYRTTEGVIQCTFGYVVNKGSRDSINGKLFTYVVETWEKGQTAKKIMEMNHDVEFNPKYRYLFITKDNTVQDVL